MTSPFYTAKERAQSVTRFADLLSSDARIEGVILVGSLVLGGDRWSDVDLQVSVTSDANVEDIANGWLAQSYAELPVLHHIAFVLDDTTRILCLLLDNLLEVDIAFTPTAKLSVYKPFRLLYDRSGAVEEALRTPPEWQTVPPDWSGAAGGLWHDALHACIAVRRGRSWQALFYIERIRTAALRLASQQRGHYAGELDYVDDLPDGLLQMLQPTLVSSLTPPALFAAIEAAVRGFLVELRQVEPDLANRLERPLLDYMTIARTAH